MSENFGPLGRTVFERTYARPTAYGLETWGEMTRRVIAGNVQLGPGTEDTEELVARLEDMRILPAGRHLWASGSASGLGLFNCHRAGWGTNLADHFTFTFDQLMLGGGLGANYSSEYLEPLPPVVAETYVRFGKTEGDISFVIEDSRQGWVLALKHLIDVSTQPSDSPRYVVFDTTKVRPAGSPIRGFGGIASGPQPLIKMLVDVAALLRAARLNGGGHLSPLEAMGIDHAIAACVISGNVRRSARMSILHWRDAHIFDFINCKADPEKHWSTNISVEIDDAFWDDLEAQAPHAVAVMAAVSEAMLTDGEPGLYNSSLASVGERGDVRSTNPCGEIALEAWEQCTLGHVNLAHPAHQDPEMLAESFALMGRFLVRATLAPSSDTKQQAIKAINRRIGVGFFGFQEWLAYRGVKYSQAVHDPSVAEALSSWKLAVQNAADAEALRLGVARPIKYTTVAPTGSIAKLPGVSEGMHPIYARHFKRLVRYADGSSELARLAAAGHPVEPCIYSANTSVVTFFVEDAAVEKFGDIIESVDEIPLYKLLATQALVQKHYADNAVSFTANVAAGQYSPEALTVILGIVGRELKGTTIFPDMSRPQSPLQRLTLEEFEAATIKETGQALDDCVTGACPIR